MTKPAPKNKVVLVLMKSPEADATLSVVRADAPDVAIEDHATYWTLTHPREIVIDIDKVSEDLGEPIALSDWLVVMSSFVGRAETEPRRFRVTTDMLGLTPQSIPA